MITYNQEQYIAEAIKGVLMQETDFSFELVIANDASTDNTDSIICDLIKNHPKGKALRYYNHDHNLGMVPNFIFAFEQSRGKYIAICEGDDYWTNPGKLQKQVSFLEENQDFVMSFHDAEIVNGSGLSNEIKKYSDYPWNQIDLNRNVYGLVDLLKATLCPTASVVFRRPGNFQFPEWYHRLPFGDMPLFILITREKKIKFFSDAWAVYRRHPASTTARPLQSQNFIIGKINMYLYLYSTLPGDVKQEVPALVVENIRKLGNIMLLPAGERNKIKKIFPKQYHIELKNYYTDKMRSSVKKWKHRFYN